jgi:hypothetical protein
VPPFLKYVSKKNPFRSNFQLPLESRFSIGFLADAVHFGRLLANAAKRFVFSDKCPVWFLRQFPLNRQIQFPTCTKKCDERSTTAQLSWSRVAASTCDARTRRQRCQIRPSQFPQPRQRRHRRRVIRQSLALSRYNRDFKTGWSRARGRCCGGCQRPTRRRANVWRASHYSFAVRAGELLGDAMAAKEEPT